MIDDYKRTIQRLEQDQSKQIEKLFYNYNALVTDELADFGLMVMNGLLVMMKAYSLFTALILLI